MEQPADDGPRAEVLEVGADRERRRVPVRLVVLATLVALVLGAVGVAVDRRLRSGERLAVAGCARAAHDAADDAWDRVSAMLTYVRPVLDNGGSAELRGSMYDLVSTSATGSAGTLAAARARCDGVGVVVLHAGLRHRRDACVAGLDAATAFLGRLADDGRVVAERWPRELSGC